MLAAAGVKAIPLPARSPNLNAFAERWVRSAKQECLSRLILFGEHPLSRALAEFSAHYHKTIKGKATNCFSQSLALYLISATPLLSVATGSEVYSSPMVASHELFDLSTTVLAQYFRTSLSNWALTLWKEGSLSSSWIT